MKQISKFGLLLLLFSLTIISCRQDEDRDGPVTEIPVDPPQINVTATVNGLVIDSEGFAIEGALVSVDNAVIGSTDQNGFFRAEDRALNQYGSLIRVEKDGYFLGANFVQPYDGSQVYTEFKLIEKVLKASFDANVGATVNLTEGGEIEIEANSIIDDNGAEYSGTVNVYAHWIDPTLDDLVQVMPGDLRAVNSNAEFRQLITYGMIGVELEDGSGNELNIANGKTAQISLPVPSEIINGAPSTIPLWHFDEGSGYWLEDGEAQFVNGSYIGEVSHFSFWNCDYPELFVELSGQLVGSDGLPVRNVRIKFTEQTNASCGFAYPDTDGYFQLKVPKNLELVMEVFDNCLDPVYLDMIGSYNEDVDLGVININTLVLTWPSLTGTILNCDGEPLTNGYLRVRTSESNFGAIIPDENGLIDQYFWNCDGSLELFLTAYDFDDNTLSDEIMVTIQPDMSADFGTLSTCTLNPEFFNINFQGNLYRLLEVDADLNPNGVLSIDGFGPDSTSVEMRLNNPVLDTPINPDYTQFTGLGVNGDWFNYDCEVCPDFEVTLTQIANASGEFYIGTYSGDLTPINGGAAEEFTGNFKVERE